jgi:hypothetical protein
MAQIENKLTESSEIYFINPYHLRCLGVELKKRNQDNAYLSAPDFKKKNGENNEQHRTRTENKRIAKYNKLKKNIQEQGFDPKKPIKIHLNRKSGKDKIAKEDGGHHRLAIAIELGLSSIPVRFVY